MLADQSLESTLMSMRNTEVTVDGKAQTIADHPLIMETVQKLKPIHFLQFATGATSAPARGWSSRPQIGFDHQAATSMIRASTCSLKLTLAINEYMSFCISLIDGATFSEL